MIYATKYVLHTCSVDLCIYFDITTETNEKTSIKKTNPRMTMANKLEPNQQHSQMIIFDIAFSNLYKSMI